MKEQVVKAVSVSVYVYVCLWMYTSHFASTQIYTNQHQSICLFSILRSCCQCSLPNSSRRVMSPSLCAICDSCPARINRRTAIGKRKELRLTIHFNALCCQPLTGLLCFVGVEYTWSDRQAIRTRASGQCGLDIRSTAGDRRVQGEPGSADGQ